MPDRIDIVYGRAQQIPGVPFVVAVPGLAPDTVRLLLPITRKQLVDGELCETEETAAEVEAAAAEILAAVRASRGRRRIDKRAGRRQ